MDTQKVSQLEKEMALYEKWQKDREEADRIMLRALAAQKSKQKAHCQQNGQLARAPPW